ncbi:calcium-binding protein [Teichococcus vastitatis]|uniref:Calcium-binding protein n=1 Tax=Teichococcus vastitatis TaxID=2307076 RepID=A0ABS9W478_9PROT|nr:calcium-binding protein [Pseudoroseomonas vastitatis]MCI0753863.1 hypothetical protein [Pseudoroseomonas vastitatis]
MADNPKKNQIIQGDFTVDVQLGSIAVPVDPMRPPTGDMARAGMISAQEILSKTALRRAGWEIDGKNAAEKRAMKADERSRVAEDKAEAAEEKARHLQDPPSGSNSGMNTRVENEERAKGPSKPLTAEETANFTDARTATLAAASTDTVTASAVSYTTIELTAGNDTREVVDSGSFRVNGLAGNDVITVRAGTTGSDLLDGGAGADRLTGAETDDIFVGGAGADTINGGAGSDTADYANSPAALLATLSSSTTATATTRPNGGDAQGDVLSGIENLVGTAFQDFISGNALANQMVGGLGDDTVRGNAGSDLLYGDGVDENAPAGGVDFVDGGADDDTLYGGGGNDTILGGFGNDRLFGGAGNDLLTAGDGNDELEGGDGVDQLVASLGDDILRGGAGADDLIASGGNDQLFGGEGDDTMDGGTGADAMSGDAGNDTLAGRGGTDTISGGEGDDLLDGGEDNDSISGGNGNDTLIAGAGADALDGGAGIDVANYATATGAVGVDLLAGAGTGVAAGDTFVGIENATGSGFADILVGNAGDNVFVGGGGADRIVGQSGVDTADYSASASAISLRFNATLADPTLAGTGTGGDAEGDSLQLIERVIGSSFADTLTGGELNDIFVGGLGADVLDGGAGTDSADYSFSTGGVAANLLTGAGPDGDQLSNMENLIGSAFNDVLTGNAATNRLEGGAGRDKLVSGAGNDILIGSSNGDLLVANGAGQKQLVGDGGTDGGPAGLDVYRIIGTGATAGAQFNIILNYQSQENIEMNSLSAVGSTTINIGGTDYRGLLLQSTTSGLAHNTIIPVGVAATTTAAQVGSFYNSLNALDADGRDLLVSSSFTADSPWIG